MIDQRGDRPGELVFYAIMAAGNLPAILITIGTILHSSRTDLKRFWVATGLVALQAIGTYGIASGVKEAISRSDRLRSQILAERCGVVTALPFFTLFHFGAQVAILGSILSTPTPADGTQAQCGTGFVLGIIAYPLLILPGSAILFLVGWLGYKVVIFARSRMA